MKYIITVNPHGGKKLGPQLLKDIKPIFDSANAELFIIETTYAGHIQDIANSIDLNNFDAFLAIGGDGSLHELVNGMLNRSDKQKIPIGMIPGGSGNSYMHDLNLTDPIIATESIINGKYKSMDVAKINVNHVIKYAVNMIGWGLVTDVGIKAEKYRWIGPSRYTILSFLEVLSNKNRYAKLTIGNKVIRDKFKFVIACNTVHVGKGMKMAPKSKLNDGLIDIIVVKSDVSKIRLFKILPKLFNGTHIEEPEVLYFQSANFSLFPDNNDVLNIDGEVLGQTPIKVQMQSKAIEIYVR